MQTKVLWAIIIVLVIVAGAIWWWAVSRPEAPQVPGEMGLEGIVTEVDAARERFTLRQARLSQNESGYSVEEKSFTIHWTEKTRFFVYENAQELEASSPLPADAGALAQNKNVRIDTAEAEGAEREALVIYILPGSSKAEIIE